VSDRPPFVFATVGTDHHPFDRLIEWVDRWAAARGGAVDVLVQSGTAHPPRNVAWTPFITQEQATEALHRATAVVCHAGPGTVMSCRSIGLIPIVVPRTVRLGEHVDDHQVSFARRMAEGDQVRVAESASQLEALLDRAIEEPAAFQAAPPRGDGSAVRRFEELVDRLVQGRGGSRSSGRPAWDRPPLPFNVR
jgi:UDP-N-acetylglucosamine transferase subunit ALG13